ncbi:hypothetical protein HK099_002636 [Clydaea vesicula]|uniref:UBA domain-containing protein n=1 Tax=Clydaea vesicula TaxID=447962 RepID=A0AAD5XZ61_9FUNG|nr:hypothetical protein HK099_002636 [Clydaea vesicula]
MNNPMIEAMMSSPEFIESMIQTNPQLQQLMRDHPEARDAIRDPAFMRQQMEAMRNPRLMQEMMRNQDRQLSNIEAHPGGFNLLTSAFSGLTGPQETSDTSTEEVNRRFAEALGVSPRSENLQGPNEEALPNPWAPPNQQTGRFAPSSPQQNPMSFLNMFGNLPQPNIQPNTQRTPSTTGAATPAATPASIDFANLMGMRSPNATQTGSVPAQMPPDLNLLFQMMQNRQQPSLNPNVPAAPFTFPYNFSQMAPSNTQPVPTPSSQTATYVPSEESKNKYSKELKELKEMGFEQVDKNVRALLASAGDVQGAVEYLLRL